MSGNFITIQKKSRLGVIHLKGQLRHLVQSDSDGNKADSVIYKKNIYVYSFAKTKVYKNSDLRVINFYSKFKLHKETFFVSLC